MTLKSLFKKILFLLAAVFCLSFHLFVYAYIIEPRLLVIHEETLKIPNWSVNLNGFKVVAISDIHGGSNHVTEEKLQNLVERANAQNPDIIVLLGDYVSQTRGQKSVLKMPIETIAENLKGFQAKYGVYAVIGNHDWWYDDKKVQGELERIGIKVLENEAASIQIGNETVWIWGIEDLWRNRRVPTKAFEEIPNKQNIIALTHNPDSLLIAPNEISLMLAGHSHGGQVNFPFYGAKAWVNDPRFMAGEVVVEGKHGFITTGIGTSIVGLRFRVPPEIAVLTLERMTD
jgi:predicted MPP superfamily phosphohydrolase